ncbi:MAG: restriction endonuclease [Desulfamplus sp.]|nr:restriction endonuclease [Desulfamplus sp.]
MEHNFTINIKSILQKYFGKNTDDIFERSQLIQYINQKTRSANKGSKSRSNFANLYAIYVLIEDYIVNGYDRKGNYSRYEGALFSRLFARQRELPFGSKLQNHSFNNRMNSEFKKYFPNSEYIPILHNPETNRYWINENLLKVKIDGKNFNISKAIVEIIDEYIKTKQDAFDSFIENCEKLQKLEKTNSKSIEEFIIGLLAPNVDARLFEIVSYSILKYYYQDQTIFWGFDIETLSSESLKLYKTGRTNANDGGIDFVMKPLGRFFQVTETLDFKKYFLDIDKIQKYPITFVVKSDDQTDDLKNKIKENAIKTYSITAIVDNKYMDCIEEIINIPLLNDRFNEAVMQGYLKEILDEIISQSKVEFNYADN